MPEEIQFDAEFVVHRIGGPDNYPAEAHYQGSPWERRWEGRGPFAGHGQYQVHGSYQSNAYLLLQFSQLVPITYGWVGTTLQIVDGLNGRYVGHQAPIRIYTEPWDVPNFTSVTDPWHGNFSVGVRALGAPTPPALFDRSGLELAAPAEAPAEEARA